MKICISTFWTGCNSQSMSNSNLDRKAMASEVKATTVGIFHKLDTQEGQGQTCAVKWIKIATGGIPDGVLVSS